VCSPVGGGGGELPAATRTRRGVPGGQGGAGALQAEAPGPRAAGDLGRRLVPQHAPAVGLAAGPGYQEVSRPPANLRFVIVRQINRIQ